MGEGKTTTIARTGHQARGTLYGLALRWTVGLAAALGSLLPGIARADIPMTYLRTRGPAANPIAHLGWGLIGVSLFVIAVIAISVFIGVMRGRPREPLDENGHPPVRRGANGMPWLYIGVGTTVVFLIGCAVWTFIVLAETSAPPGGDPPSITLDITGHQWWWEAQYHKKGQPKRTFVTANEFHIPVGQPVRIRLRSDNVIHSFWVPELAGKTDVIPGQTNQAWLEAYQPGDYRVQCTEYCGLQHAHMALHVIAQPARQFQAWWNQQIKPAAAPTTAAEQRGRRVFQGHCAVCHTVRGANFFAEGQLGPDLTHVMSRRMIGAGLVPNNTGHLAAWIANAQALKPGVDMPTMNLTSQQLVDVVSYVNSLR
jgi:cytochrome c oxidase subunit 2